MAPPKPLHIGVLLANEVQLLDLAPIDLFGMCSRKFLEACELPRAVLNLARPITIHYIGETPSGSVAEVTANAALRVTDSLDDEAVRPGKLDVLMLPGPDPRTVPSEKVREFVRGHWEVGGATVLAICTGASVAGYAGITGGRTVTGPRALVPGLRKKFPEAKWQTGQRWERDGRLWSSGGITNGQDMVAAYIRENFPGALAEVVLAMADVGGRPRGYESSVAGDNSFFLWQILRATFKFW